MHIYVTEDNGNTFKFQYDNVICRKEETSL